ncbi:MAG: glycoside hydrolase family 16 protein [Mollicutes bacterium]|nr:glycoside hydrolase family 16 protein [Mollicutes bacterium]
MRPNSLFAVAVLSIGLSACTITKIQNSSSSFSSNKADTAEGTSTVEGPSVSFESISSSSNEPISPEESSSSSISSSSSSSDTTPKSDYVPDGAKLSFQEEFNGNALNTSIWEPMIGNGSQYGIWEWGNAERQYYQKENATVEEGRLLITAKKQQVGDYAYTSARLRTKGRVSFSRNSYIEARIKMPAIPGMWPAFWMLPEDNFEGKGWPTSGEIDIMEARGRVDNQTSGALHYAQNSEGNHTYKTASMTMDSITNWHCYSVLWGDTSIVWMVDGLSFLTVSSSMWDEGYSQKDGAPFNRPFHLLLNLAVGGNFDGGVLPPSDFVSAAMEIDYVRGYSL